jgi:hypothetical protein
MSHVIIGLLVTFLCFSLVEVYEINVHGVKVFVSNISRGHTPNRLDAGVFSEEDEKRLDLKVPRQFSIAVCERALIYQDPSQLSCDTVSHDPVSFLDMDLVMGYDLFSSAFQHDLINGLPQAGLLADWVMEDTNQRGFLCQETVCNILRALQNMSKINIMNRGVLKYPMLVRSLRIAFVEWEREDRTWDCYPRAASYPATLYVSKTFQRPNQTSKKIILFLSRGSSSTSQRFIDNEPEVIRAHQEYISNNSDFSFEMYDHGSTLTAPQQQELFYRASVVVGMHGGSFSNIAYCNPNATVIEINNNHSRRDCFAGMAICLMLRYYRFSLRDTHFNYHGGSTNGGSIHMSAVAIQDLLQMYDEL